MPLELLGDRAARDVPYEHLAVVARRHEGTVRHEPDPRHPRPVPSLERTDVARSQIDRRDLAVVAPERERPSVVADVERPRDRSGVERGRLEGPGSRTRRSSPSTITTTSPFGDQATNGSSLVTVTGAEASSDPSSTARRTRNVGASSHGSGGRGHRRSSELKEAPSGWNATLIPKATRPWASGIVREVPSATEIAMYPPSSAQPRIVVPSGLRSAPKNGGGVRTRTRVINVHVVHPHMYHVVRPSRRRSRPRIYRSLGRFPVPGGTRIATDARRDVARSELWISIVSLVRAFLRGKEQPVSPSSSITACARRRDTVAVVAARSTFARCANRQDADDQRRPRARSDPAAESRTRPTVVRALAFQFFPRPRSGSSLRRAPAPSSFDSSQSSPLQSTRPTSNGLQDRTRPDPCPPDPVPSQRRRHRRAAASPARYILEPHGQCGHSRRNGAPRTPPRPCRPPPSEEAPRRSEYIRGHTRPQVSAQTYRTFPELTPAVRTMASPSPVRRVAASPPAGLLLVGIEGAYASSARRPPRRGRHRSPRTPRA